MRGREEGEEGEGGRRRGVGGGGRRGVGGGRGGKRGREAQKIGKNFCAQSTLNNEIFSNETRMAVRLVIPFQGDFSFNTWPPFRVFHGKV